MPAHVLDQALGHLQLALVDTRVAHAGIQFQAVQTTHFLRPAQDDHHHGILQRAQQREVLLGVQHHLGQGDLTGALEGFAQQRVHLAAATVGAQVVRGSKLLQGDFAAVDERKDIDGLGRLRPGLADLLFADHHVLALPVLHALDDMLTGDLLASDLVHPLVAHRLHAALVEPVEVDPVAADSSTQRHRDMHQAEADCTFPDGSGHDLFPLNT
ncbi:hypothetical protein D3C79_810870 [compost metagenome]